MRNRIVRHTRPVAVGTGVVAVLNLLALPGRGFSWPVWGCAVGALLTCGFALLALPEVRS